jgi:uncharacterized protein YutE (UPF0331/DUF86 family)
MDNRIKDKIAKIEQFIEELEEIIIADLEDYKSDFKVRGLYERYFEKIIEAIIDLAFMFIKENRFKTPEGDKEALDILEKERVIFPQLSFNLKNAKGMRNVIAHEYGEIDDELVFESVNDELIRDTKEFIHAIKRYKQK